MSLLSSDFAMSLGGQYSGNFTAPPGAERIIQVRLKTKQEGDFELKGKAFYYFGDNISTKEESEQLLPLKVRPEGETTATKPADGDSSTPTPTEIPGFVGILAIISILGAAYLLSRR